MSLESAIASRNSLLTQAGKSALNIKYPKEFELYVIALELVDEDFKTLQYFIFPVNPSSIEEIKPQLTNVKKTLSGVTVLKTPTFVPTDITLSGTFGRSFKVLLGNTYEEFLSSFTVDTPDAFKLGQSRMTVPSAKSGAVQFFDDRIKTGYGCLKIMEEMIQQSNKIGADGKIRKLILHNPALGNSYLVTAGTLRMSQNEQSNMIWNYSLPLKSIAPLEAIYTQQHMESAAKELAIGSFIQKRVNALVHTVSKLLGDGLNKVPTFG